jgi:Uma2 family endonuclease
MAEPKHTHKPATYQDVLDAPEHMVAEVVEGDLYRSPRPGEPHAHAEMRLSILLGGPFGMGRGGPGGWVIYAEPELHLGDDILVPDLAGWRSERSPLARDKPYFTVVPDWICEIVLPGSARLDRVKKLPRYARNGVKHAWIIDPPAKSLEVYRSENGRWSIIAVHAGEEVVSVEPFEAVPLELALLWI